MDDTSNTSKNKTSRFLVIGLVILLGFGLLYLLFGKGAKAEPATISGSIDFNGIKPSDANNPDLGEIKLMTRLNGASGDYTDTGVQIPFEDKVQWSWNEAEAGKTYDVIAEVYYKDFLIQKSKQVTVTAPASSIALIFNVSLEDVPEQIRPTVAPTQPEEEEKEYATISGTYVINGFVPNGSTISVFARLEGETTDFNEVKSGIPAQSGSSFAYDTAIAGTTYEVQAELYDSAGSFIGQSPYISITAPASNERIVINSTAVPPAQKATVSGTVNLNGPVQQNSTILVLQRKSGDTDYTEVNRYPAKSSVSFEWTDAVAGTTYDVTAALQVNETNTATGNVATVAAPASGVTITIDTNFNLPAPNSTPTKDCGSADQTNHFNVRVSVPQIEGAKKYNLEVGTSAGANNTYNGTLNPDTSATIYIQANSPFFARYRYTACTDCDTSNSSNWSGWSPTLGFQCP
jgi:hypothetical protein